ncbi:MAG: phosphoribosylanthranilate isomerase [bacterium]
MSGDAAPVKRVRVKIDGIRTPADVETAAAAGADAIGMIFAEARRQVTFDQAREIVAAVPPFVSTVGVFVNAPVDEVERLASDLRLSAVQLHGDESPEECVTLQRRGIQVIKALPGGDRIAREMLARYPMAAALLLDTRVEGLAGGTGRTFPWQAAAGLSSEFRIIVAGGLTPENVTQALEVLDPYGVDVTSGVETDGRKDPNKVRAFVARVREWERRA